MNRFLLFLAGLLLAPTAIGQVSVIGAARMLDVRTGQMVSPAVVVVEDGLITAVNPDDTPPVTLDLGDRTLLPGLIDMHTHLTGSLEQGSFMRPVTESAADQALRGAFNARTTLMAGFTTVRNLGSGGFSGLALARAVNGGYAAGPDIIDAGHALGITGGHCDATGWLPGVLELDYRSGVADGPAEVLKAVRYQIKHGAKVIKTCATAGVLSFEEAVGAQQYSAEELSIMVEEAARHGIKVAAHAHGSEGILAAVRAGVASIEHGSILTDEIMSEMIERGTYLVPTTYLADAIPLEALPAPIRAKAEHVLPIMRESLRRAIAAGVPIAFGTDAAVYPHGDNAREFGVLVMLGMSPLEAIRSATLEATALLGKTDRGAIAVGLRADMIAVDGNPLDDVTLLENIPFVMKSGRVHKGGGHQ
jgi:imidazolonepropionase-like amidohydrolase